MCKECELKGIRMSLSPVVLRDAQQNVQLPTVWQELEKANFHPDFMARAYAHLAWTERHGNEVFTKNARAFLSSLAKGFAKPFERKNFEPTLDDANFELKTNALNAIEELAGRYGDRVSSVIWDSLAHLATRANPNEARTILAERDTLPHHFGIVDTVLHAIGKVYTFFLDVQSTFAYHTGSVLVHNCDCSCSVLSLGKAPRGSKLMLHGENLTEATKSLFTHLCAESHLLLNCKLPFEYGLSPEALELLA